MRAKNYMAIYAAMAALLLLSCQADTDTDNDIISDDSVVESTQSSDVVVVSLTLGGEQVSTDTDDTKVSLNPASAASFLWSSQEYFTAIDMTDDYHTSADTKLCEMAATVNTVTNSAWFTFDMSVKGLDTNLPTDTGKVNFYAYTPRREYNYRYHDMIKLAHAESADTLNYNGDFMLLTYPMDRVFNIDASATVTEAYHLYGRFLPFVAIPLRDKIVTWTQYDDPIAATDDDGNQIYDEDNNALYITGETTFSSSDKFNFAGLFHTVMVRIYPIKADSVGHRMIDLDIHKSVTTITLTDGNNYFRAGDLLDLENMTYNSHIPTMIGNARVSLGEDNRTFIDSDGIVVNSFATNEISISSTLNYFSRDINPTNVVYNSTDSYTYTYDNAMSSYIDDTSELYDGADYKTTVSISDRIASGYDYMVIPVIATRTYNKVTVFTVTVKFYDEYDNLLLTIIRDVSDNSDTADNWYYGASSIVRLYEDDESFGKFHFAEDDE